MTRKKIIETFILSALFFSIGIAVLNHIDFFEDFPYAYAKGTIIGLEKSGRRYHKLKVSYYNIDNQFITAVLIHDSKLQTSPISIKDEVRVYYSIRNPQKIFVNEGNLAFYLVFGIAFSGLALFSLIDFLTDWRIGSYEVKKNEKGFYFGERKTIFDLLFKWLVYPFLMLCFFLPFFQGIIWWLLDPTMERFLQGSISYPLSLLVFPIFFIAFLIMSIKNNLKDRPKTKLFMLHKKAVLYHIANKEEIDLELRAFKINEHISPKAKKTDKFYLFLDTDQGEFYMASSYFIKNIEHYILQAKEIMALDLEVINNVRAK